MRRFFINEKYRLSVTLREKVGMIRSEEKEKKESSEARVM